MTTNSATDDTDESKGKSGLVSRREAMALIAAGAGSATLAGAATSDTSGNTGLGGGPMSEPGRRADLYDVHADDEIPDPVQGRYLRIVDDRADWDAGDLLEARDNEWHPINLGVGSLNADQAAITYHTKPEARVRTPTNAERRFDSLGWQWDNFEDLSGWSALNGSISATSDSYIGSQAMRLQADADSDATVEKSFDAPRDMTALSVSLRARIQEWEGGKVIRVSLLDSAGNRFESSCSVQNQVNDWVRFDFHEGDDIGSDDTDLTDITNIRVWGTASNADLSIDDMRFIPVDGVSPTVVLQFDDGWEEDFTVARPILNEFNMPSCHAVPTNYVGDADRLSLSQMREMQAEGAEFNSHGRDHDSALDLSVDEFRVRLEEVKKWFFENGFRQGVDHHVWPKGEFDGDRVDVAADYFRTATVRQASGPTNKQMSGALTLNRSDGESDLTTAKKHVDQLETGKQDHDLLILMFHRLGDDGNMVESDFRELIEHIDAAEVQVRTMSAVFGWS